MVVAGVVGSRPRRAGFTLVEMLVSVVILVVLMVIIFQVIQLASQAWKQTSQGASTMQGARVAFERMTRNLSQATLNNYYDYIDSGGHFPGNTTNWNPPPVKRGRQSELQFISGLTLVNGTTRLLPAAASATQITHAVFFQAPLGVTTAPTTYGALNNLMNACGYFVVYCQDPFRPTFLNTFTPAPTNEYRYRLMEYLQPSDAFEVYDTDGSPASANPQDLGTAVPKWISGGLPSLTSTTQSPVVVRPLASNILALIIMPEQFTTGTTANGEANTTYLNTPSNLASPTATYTYDSGYHTTTFTSATATPPNVQNPTANQLPPLVKVIMVAIDEPSAIKVGAAFPAALPTSPPDLGQLFGSATPLFKNPTQLFTVGGVEGDLEKFEDILSATPGNLTGNKIKLNYFVFQTDVIIRSAKWSIQ